MSEGEDSPSDSSAGPAPTLEPDPGPARRGVFGGVLLGPDHEAGLTPALLACLAGPGEAPSVEAGGARLIGARHDEGELRYSEPLPPRCLGELRDVPSRLSAVGAVALGVEALHAAGQVHGDLRPDTVRVDASGQAALVLAGGDAAGLLQARLAAGADPAEVGFV
ncbi:MAG TPA: hypothetical protein DEA08_31665, partial [Planctomycetes bacterium]|nr:hypothetical protein [Planctomycetota bacterium]